MERKIQTLIVYDYRWQRELGRVKFKGTLPFKDCRLITLPDPVKGLKDTLKCRRRKQIRRASDAYYREEKRL